jgi:hypothetical protein
VVGLVAFWGSCLLWLLDESVDERKCMGGSIHLMFPLVTRDFLVWTSAVLRG